MRKEIIEKLDVSTCNNLANLWQETGLNADHIILLIKPIAEILHSRVLQLLQAVIVKLEKISMYSCGTYSINLDKAKEVVQSLNGL